MWNENKAWITDVHLYWNTLYGTTLLSAFDKQNDKQNVYYILSSNPLAYFEKKCHINMGWKRSQYAVTNVNIRLQDHVRCPPQTSPYPCRQLPVSLFGRSVMWSDRRLKMRHSFLRGFNSYLAYFTNRTLSISLRFFFHKCYFVCTNSTFNFYLCAKTIQRL